MAGDSRAAAFLGDCQGGHPLGRTQTRRVCISALFKRQRGLLVGRPLVACRSARYAIEMAIYHLSVKTVSRSTGRSAVAAAAYRAGARLTNERDGVIHDFSRRHGVAETFIIAPTIAEGWAQDRATLWNQAEAAEKRKNSTVAREYELALPGELDAAERTALARQFAQTIVTRYGVVADIAIHAPSEQGDQRNHHAHILTTTRVATETGLGAKTRELDAQTTGPLHVEGLREEWAAQVNAALERAQLAARVDHRSHARRGLAEAPGRHLGPVQTAIARRRAIVELALLTARRKAARVLRHGRRAVLRAKVTPTLVRSVGWARRVKASLPLPAWDQVPRPAPVAAHEARTAPRRSNPSVAGRSQSAIVKSLLEKARSKPDPEPRSVMPAQPPAQAAPAYAPDDAPAPDFDEYAPH